MAENDSAEKLKLSEDGLERAAKILADPMYRNLDDIGTFLLAIKNLGHQEIGGHDETGAVTLGIISLAEKAGYLADKCIFLLTGGPGSVGDFDDWADLKPKAPEEESAAG